MIDKTQAFNLSPAEAAEIESAIKDTCAEIARSLEQMRKDQAEIVQLKIETRAMLEKLKAA